MKKFVLMISFLALGLAGGLHWLGAQKPPTAVALSLFPTSGAMGLPSARLSLPTTRPTAATTAKNSQACEALHQHLSQLNLQDSNRLAQGLVSLREMKPCREKTPQLSSMQQGLVLACQPVTSESRTLSDQCKVALLAYRTEVVALLHEQENLSQITSPKVLSDLLMQKLARDPEGAARVLQRFLEVEPGYLPAVKVNLAMKLREIASADEASRAAAWTEWEEALQRTQSLNVPDADVLDAEIQSLFLRQTDPNTLKGKALEYRSQFPNAAMADYYLGAVAHLQHDRAGSQTYLQSALQKARSQDERVRIEKGLKGEFNLYLAVQYVDWELAQK